MDTHLMWHSPYAWHCHGHHLMSLCQQPWDMDVVPPNFMGEKLEITVWLAKSTTNKDSSSESPCLCLFNYKRWASRVWGPWSDLAEIRAGHKLLTVFMGTFFFVWSWPRIWIHIQPWTDNSCHHQSVNISPIRKLCFLNKGKWWNRYHRRFYPAVWGFT